MNTVLVLLIDLYLGAVVLDWLLDSTCFQMEPGVKARLKSIVEPLLARIRTSIQPSFNGVDLSRAAAIALLVMARMAVLTLVR